MLQLVTAPDPRLAQPSRPVREDEFGSDLAQHMEAMVGVMRQLQGAGLAGVQVGDLRRLLVMLMRQPDGTSHPEPVVNPTITKQSRLRATDVEGCLSFPGKSRQVGRARQITVQYRTPWGEAREVTLSGFESRCLQHEIDHLDGKTIW